MKNNFKVGDQVLVKSLKRPGTVTVTALFKRTSYKVAVGSIEIVCKAEDLEYSTQKTQRARGVSFEPIKRKTSKVPTSLDLHGYTAAHAKEALLEFLSNAMMAGLKEVTVIHGHGRGVIKELVHSTLSELDIVASFRHPLNDSASVRVYLRYLRA